jgi:hypothetical protein
LRAFVIISILPKTINDDKNTLFGAFPIKNQIKEGRPLKGWLKYTTDWENVFRELL